MNIIEKRVKDLPYEKNPRKNDDAVQYVANSIKEFGFRVPIVIDSDNTIVCGHTRWKASKLLNMETVPCVVADDLTEEQIKAFRRHYCLYHRGTLLHDCKGNKKNRRKNRNHVSTRGF